MINIIIIIWVCLRWCTVLFVCTLFIPGVVLFVLIISYFWLYFHVFSLNMSFCMGWWVAAAQAAGDIYAKILTKIEENDYDNFRKR